MNTENSNSGDDLTAGQAAGWECVACGADFHIVDVPSVPVGIGPRGQLFACVGCAE